MELNHQRILILDDRTGIGRRTAGLAAALGAEVTLVRPAPAPAAPGEPLPDPSYQTVALDLGRPGEVVAWLEALDAPIDHLLIGHFALPEHFEGSGTRHPWLGAAWQWAYDVARRGRPPLRQSVAVFSGPVLVPAGQAVEAVPAEVEAASVGWLARALKPLRVNAAWTEPIRSPLPADPSAGERQALYLSSAPHTRSRFDLEEDVAEALLYLLGRPALSGSVLRIGNAPRPVEQMY
ncbi:MAG: hypothetical protein ICV83_08935 [Cytophagales bacterium]|nr:hypothetical protein [Cytophagales bacterium]